MDIGIISIIEQLLSFLSVVAILTNSFGFNIRSKNITNTLISLIILMVATLSVFVDRLQPLQVLLPFIILLLIIGLFGKQSYKQCVFSYLLYNGVLFTVSACIVLISSIIFTSQKINLYVDLFVNILFCVFVFISQTKRTRISFWLQIYKLSLASRIFIICSIWFCGYLTALISDFAKVASYSNWEVLIKVFSSIIVLTLAIALPIIVTKSTSNEYYKKVNEDIQAQINIQAEHYQTISKANEEVRRFRHDYNNLFLGLTKLLDSNRFEEAKEFIKNCKNTYESSCFEKMIKTGDSIVDAVINDKANKAKSHNITIDFEGFIPETKCSPTDLCVIFGNTLDNSIEACLELPNNPTISVKSETFGALWIIKITNPVLDSSRINTKELKTTKNDTFSHGFGLYSVNKSVMKYDGIIDFSCENSVFCVTISFNLSEFEQIPSNLAN